MSQIRVYKAKIMKIDTLKSMLKDRDIDFTENKPVKSYRTVPDAAVGFKLPGWHFPIAVKANGEILYDHWQSEASAMDNLGEFIQDYNAQVISDEASTFATNVYQERLADGNVLMTIQV